MNKICLATENDKTEILGIYRSLLYGPADWNENYPNEDTIDFDISRDALYVMKNSSGEIIACASIDDDPEVTNLSCWSIHPSSELARICVRQDMQGKGLVKELMKFVFDVLSSSGNKGVHILVKTGHVVALKAYKALGFNEVGFCNLFDKDFICMERYI